MASILVIDDEEILLGMFTNVLKRCGHQVYSAENGEKGIRIFENEQLDLVITDLLMPVMDGKEVAQHIRSSEKRKTPVIGMSGTPWILSHSHFDEVLVKPFLLEDLSDKIDLLTHKRERKAS